MSAPGCRYFDGCSAPICPEDPQSLKDCAWFPDEEICRRLDLRGPWVTRQRKIARVTGEDFDRGCFTLAMLSHPCVVGAAFRGLDPEQEISPKRVKEWLSEHPALKPISEERREASRTAMRRVRASQGKAIRSGFRAPGGAPAEVLVTSGAEDVNSCHPGGGGL